MNTPRMIVIGASAGGVEALTSLVSSLPADLPAALFVVLHLPAYSTSVLPDILQRHGLLPARQPADGETILPGHIYVAPPDHHLVLEPGRVRITRGPTENGVRPAVDTLFRSAARVYGPHVIGVVLSGMLDDGTAGAQAIKMGGGTMVAQDPDEALFSGMPRSAVDHVNIDYVLPLAEIGPALSRLSYVSMGSYPFQETSTRMETEVEMAKFGPKAFEGEHPGTPSDFACPECHGVLWEISEGGLVRYRCRVGHAYSPASLLAEQSDALEDALWVALRALEENAALALRLKDRAEKRGHALSATHFQEQAEQGMQRAAIIRQALLRGQMAASNPATNAGNL